jgi:hypothetical protein
MIDIDLEQPCDSNVPKPNPYSSDVDLGDLDFRLDPKQGWFATDKEIASLNSRLVIVDRENNVEHHLHSSRAELYLANDHELTTTHSLTLLEGVLNSTYIHIHIVIENKTYLLTVTKIQSPI